MILLFVDVATCSDIPLLTEKYGVKVVIIIVDKVEG